jgi:ribonuclease HI
MSVSTSSTSGLSASGTRVVTTLYSDGGVVEVNPSPVAGVWAWCAADQTGWRLIENGGFVLATDGPISNNQMEWYAAMLALEAMPSGWSGALVTDSRNVLDRLAYLRRHLGLPESQVVVPRNLPWQWYRRMVTSLLRLGDVHFRHVKGHPTAADLKRGYTLSADGARKYDVADQQVWADAECNRQATRARLSRGGEALMRRLRSA